MSFERIVVDGSSVEHGTGGDGQPVLFLHGFGVGPRSYLAPLGKLVDLGCRVLAPAQPCFGGTAALGGGKCTFTGYAEWLTRYLDAVGIAEPVVVIGHSFGAGVAVQVAHDYPDRVRAVISCNGVGGMSGLPDRTVWEWGLSLGSDLFALESMARVLPAVIGQAIPNVVQNPLGMRRVSEIVRRADLRRELIALKRHGTPVKVVWSDRDRLVSHRGFSTLCSAAGVDGVVVPGHHSWLIADPSRFADVVLRALVDAGVVEESLLRLSA